MTHRYKQEIGERARDLDERPFLERVSVPRMTAKKLVGTLLTYGILLASVGFFAGEAGLDAGLSRQVFWSVALLAFFFQTVDSAAGMGFGTALAPLLFVLGYEPLSVVPALLASQSATGLVAGLFHHEFENVHYSFDWPLNEATRVVLLLSFFGVVATVVAVVLSYVAFDVPVDLVKAYVALLVIFMGLVGLLRQYVGMSMVYRPRRLVAFALLAGLNKGIGGGGYGPVVTLGQIYSGVYEKSATAITTLAEGVVSLFGAAAYVGLAASGVLVNYSLLLPMLAGSYLAAFCGPYLVRVVPNRVWRFFIPAYAFAIGGVILLRLYP